MAALKLTLRAIVTVSRRNLLEIVGIEGGLSQMNLSDYNWNDFWEIERKYNTTLPDTADLRSPFEHDRDRIIHSVAFRRLQGKTQIFAPGQAEFLRTRVTHSIEVAQIGRSLAKIAGIPSSLVEAACLAHDLGHPPFGHTGEEILNQLMENYGGFESNAQTFRILTRLEEKTKAYPGVNLCRATLLGVLKYPYRRSFSQGKFLYDDDAAAWEEWIFRGTEYSLSNSLENSQPNQTIVCQLMDWADDIAYSVHDMEDGLHSGFLLPSLPMESITDWVWQRLQFQTKPSQYHLTKDRVKAILERLKEQVDNPQTTIREITSYYINRFVTSVKIESLGGDKNLFNYCLNIPEEVRQECMVFKALSFEFIILDERTATFAYKGREIIERLFKALFGNHRFELFPREKRELIRQAEGNESAIARLVCDHIASMTDEQAIRLYSRLFESTGSSLFEPV
ncbi:MAG: deoxyguanosinetriphosphate triphosphohydrolase [Cyanobacteria bacterium SW_10_48_33]|nr:MAG: deoxyguanosinetriphosphate triphosphohydrolase [Cyanobacteria bacterium QS_9_48_30]PSP06930.1 MAG: deoxyguanosinetriphosphate triphosphohydrolase [Cyanobacteria bacterium SW_7_48_12]PSP13709.1 MAG: deoxyguanosinetriphosphate triphosphohydrolase [Cyanobacteria bacterium SW_10_48_33]PSP20821.1 MAG: deoxyguanosinetriphosphate triphosphohydrolase [Cyanobacteria bacterium SW_5_48_44]